MKNTEKQEQKEFIEFCEKLSELWNSNPFVNLLKSAEKDLLKTKSLIEIENIDKADDGYGIYCFWIKQEELQDLEAFRKSWNKSKGKLALTQPAKKWYSDNKLITNEAGKKIRAFYMGKREKVLNRIKQHAFESSVSTYGLHLYRDEAKWQDNIEFSYFLLPQEGIEAITNAGIKGKHLQQLILTFLESSLREKFSPMVGKQ